MVDEYTATELAYKNGYEAGIKEFADKLCGRLARQLITYTLEKKEIIYYCLENIQNLVEEMTKK